MLLTLFSAGHNEGSYVFFFFLVRLNQNSKVAGANSLCSLGLKCDLDFHPVCASSLSPCYLTASCWGCRMCTQRPPVHNPHFHCRPFFFSVSGGSSAVGHFRRLSWDMQAFVHHVSSQSVFSSRQIRCLFLCVNSETSYTSCKQIQVVYSKLCHAALRVPVADLTCNNLLNILGKLSFSAAYTPRKSKHVYKVNFAAEICFT